LALSAPARADDLGRELCRALSGAVERTAPDGEPAFLASYEPGPDEREVPLPLRTTAFSYDNALAATALSACGDLRHARQIGEAFLVAIESDRTFEDGRIRNAYRAGPMRERPVLLPGWWDAANKRWSEDRYQDGTATGNVAWVGLALLNLRDATQDPRFGEGATRLAAWIRARTARHDAPGFTGGLDGYDPDQSPLNWVSTEHNLDIVALGTRLGLGADVPRRRLRRTRRLLPDGNRCRGPDARCRVRRARHAALAAARGHRPAGGLAARPRLRDRAVGRARRVRF
jgi:hypothetical protein